MAIEMVDLPTLNMGRFSIVMIYITIEHQQMVVGVLRINIDIDYIWR
jgi:hypothetical protein